METQKHENKPAIGPRSLKKSDPRERRTGKLEIYAYSITDAAFGEFFVLNSMNAWWLDKIKLTKLIDALKLECTIKEACFYAGISPRQWQYFYELHPEFCYVIEACREALGVFARQHFAKMVKEGDAGAVMTYLRKKHKAEFAGQVQLTDPMGRPVNNQNAVVFVDFGETVTTEPYPNTPPEDISKEPLAIEQATESQNGDDEIPA